LDGVAQRPVQQGRCNFALHEVIGGPRSHRLEVHAALSLPGQEDHGPMTPLQSSLPQQFQARTAVQEIVEQIHPVPGAFHRLAPRCEAVDPFKLKFTTLNFAQQIARDQIVVPIVVDQQYTDGLTVHVVLRFLPRLHVDGQILYLQPRRISTPRNYAAVSPGESPPKEPGRSTISNQYLPSVLMASTRPAKVTGLVMKEAAPRS